MSKGKKKKARKKKKKTINTSTLSINAKQTVPPGDEGVKIIEKPKLFRKPRVFSSR
ncbi:hypothetical protein KKH38_04250 [Patescibacteria group bacterium]|nr:hypothetical protein [Patescibacteria group bacterium]MBU4601228.1 hypothetical protein [Patescibacteria group bacterium]MCG2697621.1 hypothetical protein [Candidatus Parcubacteria bacterium]